LWNGCAKVCIVLPKDLRVTYSKVQPWWRGATIYQVYPRSFFDSDGDGIGDLTGITAQLDYIAALGVDALWIGPFYPSPQADFGYDVSDYRDVDPQFGTLADFDALVVRAHALGLKVIVDQVYAHTSDAHAWFAESRADRDNAKADWYVWADPKPDGSPPNNWQSVFHGPAWTWDGRRGQYYMHNFLAAQPQLNMHAPAVRTALVDVARFWLDRGVDGFRLDALNFAMHDPALTDNPPAPPGPRRRPFEYQAHIHNQSQPGIFAFDEELRVVADRYGDRFLLAEIGGTDCLDEMRAHVASGRLHSAYSFDLLDAEALTPAIVRDALLRWPDAPLGALPSWAFSNHDVPRWLSRWAPVGAEGAFARMVLQLFSVLPGNLILWQGEELGMTQTELAFNQLRDPEAIANWPRIIGRDGARTPIPWVAGAPNAGFTTGEPWLPVNLRDVSKAVDVQEGDPESLLNLTRALLAMRRTHDVLRYGAAVAVRAEGDLLVLEREHEGKRMCAAWNFGAVAAGIELPAANWTMASSVNGATLDTLPPYAGVVAFA
jgi:alpha-glucosidase